MEASNNNKRDKIIIGILAALLILMSVLYFLERKNVKEVIVEKAVVNNQNVELTQELDSLLHQHEIVKVKYGDVTDQMTEKDSIIDSNAKRIRRLIASQADYKKIKRELEYLREESMTYIYHVDSLYKVNQILWEENSRVKNEIRQEKFKSTELEKNNEELSQKVGLASMIKVYNVKSRALRVRNGGEVEKETNKAKRVNQLKICFTVGENLVVEAGKKTVYVRVARPDGKVLTLSDDHSFMFGGELIQYSMNKDIDYRNKAVDLCMYWKQKDASAEAMVGKYNVVIIIDEFVVGQSSFILN